MQLLLMVTPHFLKVVLYFIRPFLGCDYCEHGGECYFNTNVVFDNKGAIVAVYHKVKY